VPHVENLAFEEKESLAMNQSTTNERTIRIDGYLTESKLSKALHELLADRWLGEQVPVANTRQRWDMAFTTAESPWWSTTATSTTAIR
jgi:hypothetical protein